MESPNSPTTSKLHVDFRHGDLRQPIAERCLTGVDIRPMTAPVLSNFGLGPYWNSFQSVISQMMKQLFSAVVLLVVVLAGKANAGPITFDAVTDFSGTVNSATSTWSYRFSDDLNRDGSYALISSPSGSLWDTGTILRRRRLMRRAGWIRRPATTWTADRPERVNRTLKRVVGTKRGAARAVAPRFSWLVRDLREARSTAVTERGARSTELRSSRAAHPRGAFLSLTVNDPVPDLHLGLPSQSNPLDFLGVNVETSWKTIIPTKPRRTRKHP